MSVDQSHSQTPPVVRELQPPCPKCGNAMWMTRISKYDADHDLRTFECKVCDHIESNIVEFKAAG